MTAFDDFTPPLVGSLWRDARGLRRLVVDVSGDGRFVTWRRPDGEKTTRIWWATWRDWARGARRVDDAVSTVVTEHWLTRVCGFEVVENMVENGVPALVINCPETQVLTVAGRVRTALSLAQVPVGAIGTEDRVWAEVSWDLVAGDGVITLTGLHDGLLPAREGGPSA